MEQRTLLDHWMVLYRRRWIVALMVLTTAGISWLLSERITPVYESRAVFYVPQQPDRPTFFTSDAPRSLAPTLLTPTPREDAHSSYIGVLKSRTMMRKIQALFPTKELRDLERNVDVELSHNFMLQVYVRDHSPKLAADISNAYFQTFNQMMQGTSGEITVRNQQAIESQLGETRQSLAAARKALEEFEAGKGISDLSTEMAELVRSKLSFQTSLENARISLSEVDKKIVGTQQQLAREGSLYIPTELVTTSPQVDRLKKDLADLEGSISAKSTEVTGRHPDLVALRAQYQAKKKELATEIETIVKSQTKGAASLYEDLRKNLTLLLVDKEAAEARISGLRRAILDIEARQGKIPEAKAKHDELLKQVDLRQKLLESLLTDLAEAQLQDRRLMQVAVMIDPARPSDLPVFPILWLNLLVAIGLGFIGSVLYCFFLDYIQRARHTRRVASSVSSRILARNT